MVLLRWLSSWFLISKRNIQVHQKDTLDLKALNDGGRSRLNQVLRREFKVKSPLPDFLHPPSLARSWGECFHWPMGLKHYKNLTWQAYGRHDECTDSATARVKGSTTLLQHPPPPRDWHGGPFSTHGELAQGLSLTIRPSRTASPLCLFAAPQWPETGRFWGMFSKIRLNIHSSQLT